MTLEHYSQVGAAPKQALDRYAEYASVGHDQPFYFPYDPSTSQGHVLSLPSKHHVGGNSHKNNAAMSALTLLAFLFFLHILQQCLREHMNALNTPQVMIMTGGKEGEENIARFSNKKIDKTGILTTVTSVLKQDMSESPKVDDDSDEEHFMKITSSENAQKHWKKFQNN